MSTVDGEQSPALALVDAADAGDWAAARDACQRLHADCRSLAAFNPEAILLAYYHADVHEVARGDRECVTVDHADLADACEWAADYLLSHPNDILDELRGALLEYDHLAEYDDLSHREPPVRVRNLPESATYAVGEHYAETVTDLIAVEAQIVKRSSVDPALDVGVFRCLRCGHEMEVPQVVYGSVTEPFQCEDCEQKGAFRHNRGRSEWQDYQRLRLQQLPEELSDGETETIDAHLVDDLARRGLESGQRVTVVAEYVPWSDGDVVHNKLLDAVDVVLEDDSDGIDAGVYAERIEEIAGHPDPVPMLAEAVAPDHQGDPHIKESVVLQLVRGNSPTDASGKQYRGLVHMLLLGEPGTGKSNFGNAVARLSPRAKKVSGNEGTSAAGLTAALTKDGWGDAEFSVTAGALPQCSGGALFVDELDKAKPSEQNAMLEAMEDGMINLQKGGQEATLEAETAVLAAANPEGSHFHGDAPPIAQTGMDSALIDRFDLVFCPTERTEETEIDAMAEHVLDSQDVAVRQDRGEDVPDDLLAGVEPDVQEDVLEAYLSRARELTPRYASEDVKRALRSWYVDVKVELAAREESEGRLIPLTPRSLHDMRRLAEASAKARLSESIEFVDVERATRLKARSFAEMGLDVGEAVVIEEDGDGEASVTSSSVRATVVDLVEELKLEGRDYGAAREDVIERAREECGLDPDRTLAILEELVDADAVDTVDGRLVGV